jgi:DNA-binding transcriptional regulator LsrR (DeoR family)
VFPVEEKLTERHDRMPEFARQAAPYLRELILRSQTCGVTWGGMLSSLVDAFRAFSPGPWLTAGKFIRFLPLCGEPLGNLPTHYSSSSLVAELWRLANGSVEPSPSIAMVPAFIPGGFEQAELAGVKKLIGMVKSYNEVFGADNKRSSENPDLYVNKLDSIITSVGTLKRPLRHGQGTLFDTGGVTIEQLIELIRGEMGGVCIPREGLKGRAKKTLDKLNDRWTGLRLEHLESCAKRASVEPDPFRGKPGVVVISVGTDRAPFVYEAIKLGLINHLIVDDELEKTLEELVKSDPVIRKNREAAAALAAAV